MTAVTAVYGVSPSSAQAMVDAAMGRMSRRAAGGDSYTIARDWARVVSAGRAAEADDRRDVAALVGDLGPSVGPGGDNAASALLDRYLSDPATWLDDLNGPAAFVLIDDRARRMVAVRDPLGIRPLYYRPDGHAVRIASDLAALVTAGDRPDEGYLAEALTGDIVDVEGTPYAAVRRVPAAHALVVDAAGVRLTRYWDPEPVVHRGRQADHQARLRVTFDLAVRDAARGVDRVAVHVSGGLDSSSVLGSAIAGAGLTPVAGGNALPWPEADERRWMEATFRHWSLAPRVVTPAIDPPALALDGIRTHRDLPDNPNGAPLFAPLHEAFARAGARVVLTGFGGDQWWTGESAHMADLVRRARLRHLLEWRRAGDAMGEVAWTWRSFAQNGVRPLVPAALRAAIRHVRPSTPPTWIAPAFAARVDLVDRLRRRPGTRHAPSEAWRRLRWRLDSGEEALTMTRFDRMSVEHGLELRHPMYDKRLVALALSTPDDARIAGGRSRVVLREAMRDRLAPEVYRRTGKADLTPLLLAALHAPGVGPHLSLRRLEQTGWIEAAVAHAVIRRARDHADGDVALLAWSIVGVEAWLATVFGAE